MEQLVIIGASAMGREVCNYAWECGIKVKGFLDSRKEILKNYVDYPPIIGSTEEYVPRSGDVFICALGEPEQKKKFVNVMEEKGGQFTSIIHPHSYVGNRVIIGVGSIVSPNVTITTDTVLDKHVIINVNSSISHDCSIGEYTTISPGCHIAGWCKIEAGVFMGVHSACLPHVNLGERVYVAAGAVVVKSVAEGRVMGIPAKKK